MVNITPIISMKLQSAIERAKEYIVKLFDSGVRGFNVDVSVTIELPLLLGDYDLWVEVEKARQDIGWFNIDHIELKDRAYMKYHRSLVFHDWWLEHPEVRERFITQGYVDEIINIIRDLESYIRYEVYREFDVPLKDDGTPDTESREYKEALMEGWRHDSGRVFKKPLSLQEVFNLWSEIVEPEYTNEEGKVDYSKMAGDFVKVTVCVTHQKTFEV